jgi:hypothetical protein
VDVTKAIGQKSPAVSFDDLFKAEMEKTIPRLQFPVVSGGAALKQLQSLYEDLKSKLSLEQETPEKAVAGTKTFSLAEAAQAAQGAKLTEGDRLARIGGFIGGGSNRMLDYARRTAENTQKIADYLTRNPSASPTQEPAAAYA